MRTKLLEGEPFGETPDGRIAMLYTLDNGQLRVRIMDFGGAIVSLEAPDRYGKRDHVVLGFDSASTYVRASGSFGALLGRTANRIAGGSLELDGHRYALSRNEGTSTLHGGPIGFEKIFWRVAVSDSTSLALLHLSPDGDQGFPGQLSVTGSYRLDGDTLWLAFEAETTRPTPVSLSAHPYFNLAGPAAADVLGHEATIYASSYLPTDEAQIPTGERRTVDGTVFDFRTAMLIGARIREPDPQLLVGRGYDHYFILDESPAPMPRLAARLREPRSGRVLEILTTQPGLQFYTGNNLNGSVAGRGGAYRQSAGLAFEPQGFPDAVNQPGFPSTILRPRDIYRQVIGYCFTAA
jgi:aldose 1-epimerase